MAAPVLQADPRTVAARPEPTDLDAAPAARRPPVGRIAGHRPGIIDGDASLPAGLSRVRGGTFSPTVSRIHLADGTSALTDLVRLNPDVDAYSVNAHGHSPRHRGHYRALAWDAAPTPPAHASERAVTAILLASYPSVDTARLSRRLREAGYPLGLADLAEHEAIAATQAALWHVSDGIDLDCTPRNVPAAVTVRDAVGTRPQPTTSTGVAPLTAAPRGERGEVELTVTFDGDPRLDAYTLHLPDDAPADLLCSLAASSDGAVWHEVSSSRAGLASHARRSADGWVLTKGLGAGSTTARSRHGVESGYRHYRLTLASAAGSASASSIRVDHLGFALADAGAAGNSERVVHLYRYLLALAAGARESTRVAVRGPRDLVDPGAGRRFGPFSVDPSDVAWFTPTAPAGWRVTDRQGTTVPGRLPGGEQFFLVHDDDPAATDGRLDLVVDVHVGWRHRGVLLVGSTTPDGDADLTTLALVSRTPAPSTRVVAGLRWRTTSIRESQNSLAVEPQPPRC